MYQVSSDSWIFTSVNCFFRFSVYFLLDFLLSVHLYIIVFFFYIMNINSTIKMLSPENKTSHFKLFVSELYWNSSDFGAPGWLSWLSICLCSGDDSRVLWLSPAERGILLTWKPVSPSPSAIPLICALSLCQIYK